MQELQWLVLLICCLLYGLQVTRCSASIWNSCRNLCKRDQGQMAQGPDQNHTSDEETPAWMQSLARQALRNLWIGAKNQEKSCACTLAAKRPHMDMVPEIKTQSATF